jgi:hypothetical protein
MPEAFKDQLALRGTNVQYVLFSTSLPHMLLTTELLNLSQQCLQDGNPWDVMLQRLEV